MYVLHYMHFLQFYWPCKNVVFYLTKIAIPDPRKKAFLPDPDISSPKTYLSEAFWSNWQIFFLKNAYIVLVLPKNVKLF